MSTHDGYYLQKEGLAMGSAPAPHIANAWLSQFDETIKGDSVIYFRFMDDIIQNMDKVKIQAKHSEINQLHENLTFTSETEQENKISFLDMLVLNNEGKLSTKWYRKQTETGLMYISIHLHQQNIRNQ